jgi:hypothetical protein
MKMDNKKLGKVLIRHHKKELKAFFSPACCFDEEKRRKHELKIYEIQKGENIIECECGKKYKISVNGELDDFKNIRREIIEN